MKILLTNEERLARQRAWWKRQQEQRKAAAGEFKAPHHVDKGKVHQPRSGVSDRPEQIISDAEMDVRWHYFWRKRGFDTPPLVTAAGVLR